MSSESSITSPFTWIPTLLTLIMEQEVQVKSHSLTTGLQLLHLQHLRFLRPLQLLMLSLIRSWENSVGLGPQISQPTVLDTIQCVVSCSHILSCWVLFWQASDLRCLFRGLCISIRVAVGSSWVATTDALGFHRHYAFLCFATVTASLLTMVK